MSEKRNIREILRYAYLYLVTAITIVLILISTIGLLNILLREFVFDVKGYDEINYEWECNEKYSPEGDRMEVNEEDKAKCLENAEERAKSQHENDVKRELANLIAMFIVAFPLYFYHWGILRKEGKIFPKK